MELAKVDSQNSFNDDDEELKRKIAEEEELYMKAKESRELLEEKMRKLEEERRQLLERIGSDEVGELPVTQKASIGEEVQVSTVQRSVVEGTRPKGQDNIEKKPKAAAAKEEEKETAAEEKEEEEEEGLVSKIVGFVSSYFNWE